MSRVPPGAPARPRPRSRLFADATGALREPVGATRRSLLDEFDAATGSPSATPGSASAAAAAADLPLPPPLVRLLALASALDTALALASRRRGVGGFRAPLSALAPFVEAATQAQLSEPALAALLGFEPRAFIASRGGGGELLVEMDGALHSGEASDSGAGASDGSGGGGGRDSWLAPRRSALLAAAQLHVHSAHGAFLASTGGTPIAPSAAAARSIEFVAAHGGLHPDFTVEAVALPLPAVLPGAVGPPPLLQSLFINGARQQRARYPNANADDGTGPCFSATQRAGEGCDGWSKCALGATGTQPAPRGVRLDSFSPDRGDSPTQGCAQCHNGGKFG